MSGEGMAFTCHSMYLRAHAHAFTAQRTGRHLRLSHARRTQGWKQGSMTYLRH